MPGYSGRTDTAGWPRRKRGEGTCEHPRNQPAENVSCNIPLDRERGHVSLCKAVDGESQELERRGVVEEQLVVVNCCSRKAWCGRSGSATCWTDRVTACLGQLMVQHLCRYLPAPMGWPPRRIRQGLVSFIITRSSAAAVRAGRAQDRCPSRTLSQASSRTAESVRGGLCWPSFYVFVPRHDAGEHLGIPRPTDLESWAVCQEQTRGKNSFHAASRAAPSFRR